MEAVEDEAALEEEGVTGLSRGSKLVRQCGSCIQIWYIQ